MKSYLQELDETICDEPWFNEALSETDVDIAQALVELGLRDNMLYCLATKTWYCYQSDKYSEKYGTWQQRDGKDYTEIRRVMAKARSILKDFAYLRLLEQESLLEEEKPDTPEGVAELANRVKQLQSLQQSANSVATKLAMNRYQRDIISVLPSLLARENVALEIDSQRHLLAFKDGVFDLDTGLFKYHNSNYMIETTTGYNFPFPKTDHIITPNHLPEEDETEKELWEVFYSMHQTKEDAQYMIDSLAYCLHGDKSKFDYFFVWVGLGGNGKGVMLELIDPAFGDYWGTLPVAYLTQKRTSSSAAQPEIARKKGKRLLTSTEPEEEMFRTDKIKELSDKMEARDLYKSPITFRPQFALLIQSNNDPRFSKTTIDGGTLRRYRGQRFVYQFKEKPDKSNPFEKQMNPELKSNLRDEKYRDAFMRILIKTFVSRVRGKPLQQPSNVLTYMEEMHNDNDKIGSFLKEVCEVTGNESDKVNKGQLFREFALYAGSDKRTDDGQFGKKLKQQYGIKSNARNYLGIKLLPPEEEEVKAEVPPSFLRPNA